MSTLLVIDDEPNVLYALENALRSDSLSVVSAATARLGIRLVRETTPDAVLLDVRLPDMSGLDAFLEIHAADPHLPVIMMTAFSTHETAIEAMKRGAFEYLTKPVDLKQLREIVTRALDLREMTVAPPEFVNAQPRHAAVGEIVGRSPAMQEVYKSIGRVTATDVNVLILGESGTGKELVARAVHHHSHRGKKPLMAINCAAIPETLLESELFGHERGAFTGADRRRKGRFEQASGGTIFLDEIGDMTPATQAKVLRVLQDQRFERVGGHETVQTDARVIAATNQNLEELAAAGRFRRDLYYRLKVYTISMPPLRERSEDIPSLVEHFVQIYSAEVHKHVRSLSPGAIELLQRYAWPGNVRELQGAIKNALVNATDQVLTADCLPGNIRQNAMPVSQVGTRPHVATGPQMAAGAPDDELNIVAMARRMLDAGEPEIYHKILTEVDRVLFDEVLRHLNYSQVEAARQLGISRTTLRAKLQALGAGTGEVTRPSHEQPGQ